MGVSVSVVLVDRRSGKINSLANPTQVNPFFLYWKPDSLAISALGTMAESDSLALIEIPTLGGRASMLGVGRPFFWHWSPNSKSFVSHYNELMPGTTGEENWTISLNLTSGTKIERTDIGLQSGNFQTPAFSPEGNSIAIVIRNSGEQKALTLFSPIGENTHHPAHPPSRLPGGPPLGLTGELTPCSTLA